MKMTFAAGVAALLALAASAGLAEEAGQSASGTCTTQDQQPAALPPVSHTKTFQVVGR